MTGEKAMPTTERGEGIHPVVGFLFFSWNPFSSQAVRLDRGREEKETPSMSV